MGNDEGARRLPRSAASSYTLQSTWLEKKRYAESRPICTPWPGRIVRFWTPSWNLFGLDMVGSLAKIILNGVPSHNSVQGLFVRVSCMNVLARTRAPRDFTSSISYYLSGTIQRREHRLASLILMYIYSFFEICLACLASQVIAGYGNICLQCSRRAVEPVK